MSLNAQRDRITRDLESSLYVEASAGTGKTTALIERICQIVLEGKFTIDQIVAITFTRLAAAELRYRAMERLERERKNTTDAEVRQRIDNALIGLSVANFQTIDSFLHQRLREYHTDFQLPPEFMNLLGADIYNDWALKDAWHRWCNEQFNRDSDSNIPECLDLAGIYGLNNPLGRLFGTSVDLMRQNYLALADCDFSVARQDNDDVLWHLAGELLGIMELALAECPHTDDKLWGYLNSEVRLALLNLRKTKAGEYEFRHAFMLCCQIKPKNVGRQEHWSWVVQNDTLRGRIERFSGTGSADELSGKKLVLNAVEHFANRFGEAYTNEVQHITGELLNFAKRFVLDYSNDKRIRAQLEYQDVLNLMLLQLAQKGRVYAEMRKRFPVVLVDEFQDTSPAQVELVKLLTAGDENSLFVVGDPKQSIYGFRGAEPDVSNAIKNELAGQNGLVHLGQNWRSLPDLVNWVKQLFNPLFAELTEIGFQKDAMQFETSSEKEAQIAPHIRVAGGTYLTGREGERTMYKNLLRLPRTQKWHSTIATLKERGYAVSLVSETKRKLVLGVCEVDGDFESVRHYALRENEGRECYIMSSDASQTEKLQKIAELQRLSSEQFDCAELRADEVLELVKHIGAGGLAVRDGGEVRASRYADICILYRSRSGTDALQRLFDDNGIDYLVEGKFDLLRSPFINDVVNTLIALDEPNCYQNLLAALKSPLFGCSDVDFFNWKRAGGDFEYLGEQPEKARSAVPNMAEAFDYLKHLHQKSKFCNYTEILHALIGARQLKCSLLMAHDSYVKELRKLEILEEQALALLHAGRRTLTDFVEWCKIAKSAKWEVADASGTVAKEMNALKMMTIHAAKGLEFPIVILLATTKSQTQKAIFNHNAEEVKFDFNLGGDFQTPGYEALAAMQTRRDFAEEARLHYVAMTRARDHLFVSLHRSAFSDEGATFEKFMDGTRKNLPSPTYFVEKHLPPDTQYGFPIAPIKQAAPEPKRKIKLDDYAEWLANHNELLRRASTPDVVLASQIGAHFELDIKQPQTETGGDGLGLAIGNAVHELLQTIDPAIGSDDLTEQVRRTAEKYGLVEHRAFIAEMVTTTLKSPVVKRATNAKRYWKEVSANCLLDSGIALVCRVDLMFMQADGTMVLVDYKTDSFGAGETLPSKSERHNLQLAACALAIEKSTGKRVADAYLFYCRRAVAGDDALYKVPNLRDLMRQVAEYEPQNADRKEQTNGK